MVIKEQPCEDEQLLLKDLEEKNGKVADNLGVDKEVDKVKEEVILKVERKNEKMIFCEEENKKEELQKSKIESQNT